MCDRHGQIDVPHALATDDRARHLHAALLADHTRVAHSFIFSAETLKVLGGPENALTEEAVRLGTLRSIVDGLGLGHFAAAPRENVFGAGDTERDGIEGIGSGGRAGGGHNRDWELGLGTEDEERRTKGKKAREAKKAMKARMTEQPSVAAILRTKTRSFSALFVSNRGKTPAISGALYAP